MKKVYEDFFNKLDENELDFFKIRLKKEYSKRKEANERELRSKPVISTNIVQNNFRSSNWIIEKKDNSLDLFVLYLESKGLIQICGKSSKHYDFFITELGVAFLEYIIYQ